MAIDLQYSPETIFCDISIKSNYDHTRIITVDGIADIENDGIYEIFLKDIRYAGFSYYIIHLTNTNFLIKKIHADSWD